MLIGGAFFEEPISLRKHQEILKFNVKTHPRAGWLTPTDRRHNPALIKNVLERQMLAFKKIFWQGSATFHRNEPWNIFFCNILIARVCDLPSIIIARCDLNRARQIGSPNQHTQSRGSTHIYTTWWYFWHKTIEAPKQRPAAWRSWENLMKNNIFLCACVVCAQKQQATCASKINKKNFFLAIRLESVAH